MFLLRQAFVLACVKMGEVIVIDILALRTPLFFKTFGWFTTLMIVQARGWPFVLTFWSVADFCCLYGSHRVSKNQMILSPFSVCSSYFYNNNAVISTFGPRWNSLQVTGCFGKTESVCSTKGRCMLKKMAWL